jgi:tRNA A-37 threonylcarbamoyl transferase component Bud32
MATANDPNMTIGNFQLLRTLGEGGMGVVYEAKHITMHRRAAIKVLRSQLIRDEQAIRRFFNEARATNEIRHPGIVQIYDCGTREDGSPWLIMELLEGETLSRRIAQVGQMPAADVITLGAQTASVLEAAHRAGIIHRDLKPDNLFIVNNQETPSGERVKVLDFGIAKLTSTGAAKSMHTQTGVLMGTPLYMSPEQCRGTAQVDARSDIYSFGLILYQMVAGELPFISDGMGELFDMQMNRPPPPLERKHPAVNRALAEVIYKTLKKDPAQRFQTMAELQRALLAVNTAAAAHGVAPIAAPAPRDQSAPAKSDPHAAPAAAPLPGALPGALSGSSTTLSASAMALDPLQVPRNSMARPLMVVAALLVGGGALFVGRVLTHAPAAQPADPVTVIPAATTRVMPAAPAGPTTRAAPAVTAPATARPTSLAKAPAPAPARITVDIKSSPSEARVIDTADGRVLGMTPLHQTWDRTADPPALLLRLEKPGYLPKSLTVPGLEDFHGSVKLERAEDHERREHREPGTVEPGAAEPGEHIIKL